MSSAVTVSTKSVNTTTSERRRSRAESSVSPSVKLVSSAEVSSWAESAFRRAKAPSPPCGSAQARAARSNA